MTCRRCSRGCDEGARRGALGSGALGGLFSPGCGFRRGCRLGAVERRGDVILLMRRWGSLLKRPIAKGLRNCRGRLQRGEE